MDTYDLFRLYKTLHVIAVVVLGGGFVLEAIAGPLVARAKTVGEVRAYARMMHFSETYLSLPAALFVAGFGYATASKIDLDYSQFWIGLSQALFYGLAVLAVVFLRPAAAKLHKLAEAAPDGPVTPEITAQLKRPLPMVIGPVITMMFIVIIYLMVSKPGI
jgi:uncharacterized membrane protein